jgi:hypothetical protein
MFLKKAKRRDVQLHAAVTIMPRVNSTEIIGEKDQEVAQFCVQLDAKFGPFTRKQVDIAFEGLKEHCFAKMRAAGLLRSGE